MADSARVARTSAALASGVLVAIACARAVPDPAPELARAQPSSGRHERSSSEPVVGAFAGADTVRVDTIAPGVVHVYAWESQGPWAVHVLSVEQRPCTRFEARRAGAALAARAGTSEIARAATAGVNADFFALPDGTPVNAHATGGELHISPSRDWPGVGFSGANAVIGRIEVQGEVRFRGSSQPLGAVNRTVTDTGRLTLFTAAHGTSFGADTAAPVQSLRLRRLDPAGGRGRAVASSRAAAATGATLDTAEVVLAAPILPAPLAQITPGDTLEWHVEAQVCARGRVCVAPLEIVGGFPELLRDGQRAAERDRVAPAFGALRHPRTALGIDRDRSAVLLVTVDGRQAPYSDGMTLGELTRLLLRLGADDALNLDGGGSTTMAIGGQVVNRPSDREGERAVGNAILVHADDCRAGP
ncbi:MAG: phosphodiester glycosidase family protein [Longimicrobiales bacterium]